VTFKVIEFGANREPVYDFLLVINSKLGPVSHRYEIQQLVGQKSQIFRSPFSFSVFVRSDPFEFMENLYGS